MKRLLQLTVVAVALAVSTLAFSYDYNSSGYGTLKELKAWDSHVDIYFSNGQEHQCSGGSKTRFLIDPDDEAKLKLLLSAFLSGKTVQLAYDCDGSGYPQVVGVRMR